MTEGRQKGRASFTRAVAPVGLAVLVLTGCGKSASSGSITDTPAASATPNEQPAAAPPSRYEQPFDEATTTQIPDEALPPPNRTIAGQSTARMHLAVREVWQQVKLTDDAGKPVLIVASLDTDAGPVEITLFPEYAPNHVRNFLALARVGYYSGLVFERVIRQELVSEGGSKQRLEAVTAGCPNGDGEPGPGHLGYFLKPEVSGLGHDEGTVGFARSDDPNSACCRFYICLSSTPAIDGQFTSFGKVTQGLDVVRAIAARPVKDPANYPGNELFRNPARIRKVERK